MSVSPNMKFNISVKQTFVVYLHRHSFNVNGNYDSMNAEYGICACTKGNKSHKMKGQMSPAR